MGDTTSTLADWERDEIARANASDRMPVMFVHGLWLLSSSWAPWREFFEDNGFVALAPSWPDDPATVAEAREHPEAFAKKMVQQVTDHYLEAVAELDRSPAVIGHSTGGLIAQKIAGEGVAAVVALFHAEPAEPNGRDDRALKAAASLAALTVKGTRQRPARGIYPQGQRRSH